MITKADLQKMSRDLLQKIDPTDPKASTAVLQEILRFTAANLKDFDDEAKKLADLLADTMQKGFEDAIKEMPPSQEKIVLERKVAQMANRHLDAAQQVSILAIPPLSKSKVIEDADVLFKKRLQNILDWIFDANKQPHKGEGGFARSTLMFSVVNELLTAHHLAQRAFVNQAYSHIRTILELLDKITLFTDSPEWAAKWVHSADDRSVQHELRPAGVREKIGKEKYDPVYGFLSALGVHGTFEGVRVSTFLTKKEEDQVSLTCWVGGNPDQKQVLFVNLILMWVLIGVLYRIAKSFGDRLNPDEVIKVLAESAENLQQFFREHLIEPSTKKGIDVKSIKNVFDNFANVLKGWPNTQK